MQVLLNPVLIAGFDILFVGKRGFSSLARAQKIMVRPKGKKRPWLIIDVAKFRKKKDKERALYKVLQKESFAKDLEKKPRRAKKKSKVELKTEEIQFKLVKTTDKIITDKRGHQLEIRKLHYEVPRALNFVKGKDYDVLTVQRYLNAVKREFRRIQKKYGKTSYFVRLHHQYKGLPSNVQIDPDEKGFGGFALHRQVFKNDREINDQFDQVLSREYPESFTRYLRFSSTSTNFDFIGFMVEVTVEDLGSVLGKRRAPSRFKVTIQKKPKKKLKKRGKTSTKLARSTRSKKR